MFELKHESGHAPVYMTEWSAGADLTAREKAVLQPGKVVAVPTGVWIKSIDTSAFTDSKYFELQIRARSGLAFKYGIMLANGVGTIDADYRDEIKVLLLNTGSEAYEIGIGERIGQMVLAEVSRIPGLEIRGKRSGGFGSTGKSVSAES